MEGREREGDGGGEKNRGRGMEGEKSQREGYGGRDGIEGGIWSRKRDRQREGGGERALTVRHTCRFRSIGEARIIRRKW